MHHFVYSIYINFNTVHAMSDINNIYQFQDISRIFARVRERTDRQTECINTFQLCWKVLKTEITKYFSLAITRTSSYLVF